jgi:hypothetical protein
VSAAHLALILTHAVFVVAAAWIILEVARLRGPLRRLLQRFRHRGRA